MYNIKDDCMAWRSVFLYLKNFVVGYACHLSFAPFFCMPMFFVSFGWLYYKSFIDKNETFCCIFAFFSGVFIGLLHWLVAPLTLSNQTIFLIPLALLIPAICLGLPSATVIFIIQKYTPKYTVTRIVIFSVLLSFLFFFFGELFPQFPWILPAYIFCAHEIFLQTAPWFGAYGLGFIAILLSSLSGEFFINYKNRTKIIYTFFSIIGCMIIFGYFRLYNYPTTFTYRIAKIVQGNISQKDKGDRNKKNIHLQKYIDMSLHIHPVDLIIWPEATVPYLYNEKSQILQTILKQPVLPNEYLITGVVRQNLTDHKIYNSVIAINSEGECIAMYDKKKLVPFGEYVPFRKIFSFASIASTIGDFDVGTLSNIFFINDMKIMIANCYEVIFPHKRCDADFIINVTNDGWFDHTIELFQHLAIVKFKAAELGMPIIRVTNFGVSAVFDPCGRQVYTIPVDASESIDINIPAKITY